MVDSGFSYQTYIWRTWIWWMRQLEQQGRRVCAHTTIWWGRRGWRHRVSRVWLWWGRRCRSRRWLIGCRGWRSIVLRVRGRVMILWLSDGCLKRSLTGCLRLGRVRRMSIRRRLRCMWTRWRWRLSWCRLCAGGWVWWCVGMCIGILRLSCLLYASIRRRGRSWSFALGSASWYAATSWPWCSWSTTVSWLSSPQNTAKSPTPARCPWFIGKYHLLSNRAFSFSRTWRTP